MWSLVESYFSVLMLFGASHAALSIYLLLKNKEGPFSNKMLSLLLFSWGFSCYWFFAFIYKAPLFSVAVTTFIGPMLALTLFPPIYLYAKYVFYGYSNFQLKDHLHFLPIYIYLLFTLYLYFDSGFSIAEMREHKWYRWRMIVSAYTATFQGVFYFVQTRKIINLWQQSLLENFSDIESRQLAWFQNINYGFALVFTIGGISTLLKSSIINPYALYMAYHAVIAMSLTYITVIIYQFPILFVREDEHVNIEPNEKTVFFPFNRKEASMAKEDELKYELLVQKLEQLMRQKKLYKNPNFSLNELAQAAGESRNAISHVLNNHLKKSFYHYVNELRIEESKILLADENMLHYSIEGIASLSGFKTMSVFYRFFKASEKVTPSVYRKKMMESKSTE